MSRRQVKQTEDTITLLVEWESLTPEKRKGTAGAFSHSDHSLTPWLTDLPFFSLHGIMDGPDQERRSFRAVLPLHGIQGRN